MEGASASAAICEDAGCSPPPKLRCQAGTGLEYHADTADGIQSGWYDAMPTPECDTSEWSFRRGDVFTALYFMGDVHPTDVHIEPFESELKVKYRIDGVLIEQPPPPKHLQPALIGRIKIMAGMNIAERYVPQDGHITPRRCPAQCRVHRFLSSH